MYRRHEELFPEDKENFDKSRHPDYHGDNKIPKSGKNPALAELQAVRERQAAEAKQPSDADQSNDQPSE